MRVKLFFFKQYNSKEMEEQDITELIPRQLFNLDDLSKR